MEFTKAQKKILGKIKSLGSGLASAGMLSHDLGLKVETVKRHLNKLSESGALNSSDCNFHENTKVYELTEEANFWLSPTKIT